MYQIIKCTRIINTELRGTAGEGERGMEWGSSVT